ncbi:aryl-sulfate sulfotransferase [candidate division KSB1 bacterium]|nr:aryl-sulfate sulfotransferase [candidate division KSB1 bacterium]
MGAISSHITYHFPKDGAKWVTPKATIILKFNTSILSEQYEFTVIGDESGVHIGDKIISPDQRTLIFKPQTSFSPGEEVQVIVVDAYNQSELLQFEFMVSSSISDQLNMDWINEHDSQSKTLQSQPMKTVGHTTILNGVSVPSDFPEIHTQVYEATAPGRVFFNTWYTTVGRYLIICENDGTPYFYRRFTTALADFKVQPSGVLSAFIMNPRSFMIFDNHYNQINAFTPGHGYWTDPHDFVLLPNGHALIIAFEWLIVDMREIVPGGSPNAQVLGNHIQEVDSEGNVYLEFRCWDHYQIQDVVHKSLTSNTIDYTHTNSVAVDYDSNYVISVRHFNEITKINRYTGEIIWRLGGPNNQFDFINDPYELDYQHHARPVPGKPNHYTVFDNGNHRTPEFSRAVEFRVDTVNMTAENVWEFRYSPDLYASGMGSVQRLPNGNTFIDWGRGPPTSWACEVDSSGNVIYETERLGIASYRSKRFEWEGMLDAPYLIAEPHNDCVTLIFNKFGDENVNYYRIFGDTLEEPTNMLMNSQETTANLTDLINNITWYFRVTAVYNNGQQSTFSNTQKVKVKFFGPGKNHILNGAFSDGSSRWYDQNSDEAEGRGSVIDGQYHMQIENGGTDYSHIQVVQENIELSQGETYLFEFDAYSDSIKVIDAKFERRFEPYENYGETPLSLINEQMKHFSYEFIMKATSDYNARVVFNCGGSDGDVYLDNVSLLHIDPTGIESYSHVVPTTMTLHQNYPNPFNASTRIQFDLPKQEIVILKIYDMLGREIETLVNERKRAGSHTINFDASDLSNGIYLYRLDSPSKVQTQKMILLK